MTPIPVNGVKPRTDADIFVEARRALDHSARVPSTVHAHVDQGVVTLTGSVRSDAERADAAAAVRNIGGVRRVVNDIVVGRRPADASGPQQES
jgi:osmotically-inducible protein OsmY